ncbi:hypothetical protein, partial [Faecalibaculum rodentium]
PESSPQKRHSESRMPLKKRLNKITGLCRCVQTSDKSKILKHVHDASLLNLKTVFNPNFEFS